MDNQEAEVRGPNKTSWSFAWFLNLSQCSDTEILA